MARAEQVLRVLPPLAQIHQQHLGLAVSKAGPIDLPYRLQRVLGQLPNVIRWVCGYAGGRVGVLRPVAMKRGLDADAQGTAQRALPAQLLGGAVNVSRQRLLQALERMHTLAKHPA